MKQKMHSRVKTHVTSEIHEKNHCKSWHESRVFMILKPNIARLKAYTIIYIKPFVWSRCDSQHRLKSRSLNLATLYIFRIILLRAWGCLSDVCVLVAAQFVECLFFSASINYNQRLHTGYGNTPFVNTSARTKNAKCCWQATCVYIYMLVSVVTSPIGAVQLNKSFKRVDFRRTQIHRAGSGGHEDASFGCVLVRAGARGWTQNR